MRSPAWPIRREPSEGSLNLPRRLRRAKPGSVNAMLLLALAGAAIAGAGCDSMGGPIPATPAYDVDVRPLLMAHCVRCHGAGGMTNIPKMPTGPNAPPISSLSDPYVQAAISGLCFNQYADGDGKIGAKTEAGSMAIYVDQTMIKPSSPKFMPPPPAQPLDDWAVGVLKNWALNPICSNSSNPDPSICP
jgi:cytochrome c553